MKHLFPFFLLALLATSQIAHAQRMEQSLAGEWDTGLGLCLLPGTTDESHLGGGEHSTTTTSQLTRLFPFTGVVEYERTINISPRMAAKPHLQLYMERTKPSTLWIDNDSIGHQDHLIAPHCYTLPRLAPGKHLLRICIDNRQEAVPSCVHGSHAWSDATQTNWNGVLGEFKLVGLDAVHLTKVDVYPDGDDMTGMARIQVWADKAGKANITLRGCARQDYRGVKLLPGNNELIYTFPMSKRTKLWSEFHPELTELEVQLQGKGSTDKMVVRFGVRKFGTEGTQFTINGYKTFLRGTHDACVFPLSGYCPTDVEQWKELFLRAKSYGINHYRFHSYTPTRAAFEAADEVGIYLQTELPIWGTIDSTTVEHNQFELREARMLLDYLGNHPSFMSLALGNELWGDTVIMHRWLDEFRQLDPRHLYCYGSNNFLGWRGAPQGEDYLVTCRVGGSDDYKANTRSSFSFADEADGGLLNHRRPNTSDDYSYPVGITPRPIVSHETCQFQMYPDYAQIDQYTGVLYPYNLEIFRRRLQDNGLEDQAADFTTATSTWALDCYKADIEQCVRTPGFGGYQLLDLKDYPGQGSALCGILDAFMQQKNPHDSCVVHVMQPVVPMAILDSLCWSSTDTLRIKFALANYLEQDWTEPIRWELAPQQVGPFPILTGAIGRVNVKQGEMASLTTMTVPLGMAIQTCALTLTLTTGEYSNSYQLWVYNEGGKSDAKGVMVADTLDNSVINALNAGKRVLLSPRHKSIERQSVGGLFTPDYWNYAMFKTISENNNKPVSPGTLGMLIDPSSPTLKPSHPLQRFFPHQGHTSWQWWSIAHNSRPLILNSLPRSYRPLIQMVDNIERNHKLGILMEFRVGKGSLLLSTTDLQAIDSCVEGRQYRRALLQYAASPQFAPTSTITVDELYRLLYTETETRDIQGVDNVTDYNKK